MSIGISPRVPAGCPAARSSRRWPPGATTASGTSTVQSYGKGRSAGFIRAGTRAPVIPTEPQRHIRLCTSRPSAAQLGRGDIIDYAPYGTVLQECVRARIVRSSLPNAGPARWITGCRPRRSTRRGRTASSSSCGVSPWTGTCSSSRCYTRTAPFRLVASEWPSASAPSLLPAPAHMQ